VREIEGEKRPETREKRIAGMMDALRRKQGKGKEVTVAHCSQPELFTPIEPKNAWGGGKSVLIANLGI